MDLVLTGLIALVLLILFLRSRSRRPTRKRPAGGDAPTQRPFFTRHDKDDWRYWRDLAITLGMALALLIGVIALTSWGVI